MNRRSFLKILGLVPLVPLAAKLQSVGMQPSAEGPLREIPEFPYYTMSRKGIDVVQTLERMPTMANAWLCTTTFKHGGKGYIRQTLWDEVMLSEEGYLARLTVGGWAS